MSAPYTAPMTILNFGSLNLDHVYRVPHLVRDGETLSSQHYATFAGGKGANQSMALARAGATVRHAGAVGQDGPWLLNKLADAGVDVSGVRVLDDTPTGHAVIQVDDAGQNGIFLFAGANHALTTEHIDAQLHALTNSPGTSGGGEVLLMQNETNAVAQLIARGSAAGLHVCFNPAPFTAEVLGYPLELVSTFVVNETEAAGLAGSAAEHSTSSEPAALLERLAARFPHAQIVLTCGAAGVLYGHGHLRHAAAGRRVNVVDTTAAGDTFLGYFLASRVAGLDVSAALERATRAAALCVRRPGAMDSIPTAAEVDG